MGMLLYLMEQQNKQNVAGAIPKEVAPAPTSNPEIEVVKEEKPAKNAKPVKKVSRQEIMKMNVATVREYAKTQGIEDADEKSGAELKRVLCDRLFDEAE